MNKTDKKLIKKFAKNVVKSFAKEFKRANKKYGSLINFQIQK